MKFDGYENVPFYDEMFESSGTPRRGIQLIVQKIESLPAGELKRKQAAAEQALYDMGITFNVVWL